MENRDFMEKGFGILEDGILKLRQQITSLEDENEELVNIQKEHNDVVERLQTRKEELEMMVRNLEEENSKYKHYNGLLQNESDQFIRQLEEWRKATGVLYPICYCFSCGKGFLFDDHGYSDCSSHKGKTPFTEKPGGGKIVPGFSRQKEEKESSVREELKNLLPKLKEYLDVKESGNPDDKQEKRYMVEDLKAWKMEKPGYRRFSIDFMSTGIWYVYMAESSPFGEILYDYNGDGENLNDVVDGIIKEYHTDWTKKQPEDHSITD